MPLTIRSSRGEPDRDLRRPRHPERREWGTYTSKVTDTDLSITRVTGRGHAGPKRPLGDTGILWSPIIEGGIGYGTFNNHFDDGPLDGNKSTVTSLAVFLGGGVRFTLWEDWSLAPTFGIIYAHTENDFDARNEAGQNVLRLAGAQVNDLINWSADTITLVPGMEGAVPALVRLGAADGEVPVQVLQHAGAIRAIDHRPQLPERRGRRC